MATIGVATSVGSVGPTGTPDVSTGNFYVCGQTPWGIDGAYQTCSSFSSFVRLYGGLNKLLAVATNDLWSYDTTDALVQCYYAVKSYFAEKQPGSPGVLYFSRAIASSSGPAAATGSFNDVTVANPTTVTSKWKASAANTVTVAWANPSPRAIFTTGAGTLAVTNASATVTGSGTAFAATDVGKGIQISGVNYTIKTYSSATSITISPNYAGTTLSGLAYGTSPASCQATVTFPRANIVETWQIATSADATSASQKSELVTFTLPVGGTLPATAAATKLTGGTDGSTSFNASDADYVGTTAATGAKTGLQVFNDQRLGLGYVAIPGKYSATTRAGINTHCASYYRLGIHSGPSGLNPNTVVADLGGMASNTGNYYVPQVIVSDENSDTNGRLTIDNSGAIAGLAARMIRDYNFGPHKSPAGKTHPFVSLVDIERQSNGMELYVDGDSNTLADSFINTIRVKNGFVVWGNRTLATDRRWGQFNTAQTICQVIVTGQLILEKYVFEPIDDKLFATVRSDFKVFMLDLFKKGALYGNEPGQNIDKSDAFSIVCDRSNNPDNVIVNNEFRVDVAFVPKPNAEKVTFTVAPAAPGFAGRAAQ